MSGTWLADRRGDAAAADAALPVPTIAQEHWRYTNLRGIDFTTFARDVVGKAGDIAGLVYGNDRAGGRIAMRNATVVAASLDPAIAADGVVFAPLERAAELHPELVERHLGSLIGTDEKFAAENAALWSGGVFVYVPRGVHVEAPLHAAFEIATAGSAQHWRVLVVIEDGADATFIEEHAPGQPGYANGVCEVIVGRGARLRYVTVQDRHLETLQFSAYRTRVEQDATLEWVAAALGSRLGKTRMESQLAGPGSTMRLSGGYVLRGSQHVDLDTTQEHDAPHAVSDLMFKGVLTDEARSVWRGVIRVAEGAQKTDSYQENRNLVLSPRAHADSIPGLEIKANDVRCTHGATIGRVDDEQLYYLMSRGLPRLEAERLVVHGFLGELAERIPDETIREPLLAALVGRLG